MHIGSRYKLNEFLRWTRRDIYTAVVCSTLPTAAYQLITPLPFPVIPWVAVALVGTAAAFIVGFKNTQTYNRLWEARQIWGAIVNASRGFGVMARDFVDADKENEPSTLIHRHVAWLTALRFQLRKPQVWESQHKPYFKEYKKAYVVQEWEGSLEQELEAYLSPEELAYVLSKKNRATHILALQSKQLKVLKKQGRIGDFEYVEIERCLVDLYAQQGKCERIKNFPYPRQFSSITFFFINLFVFLLPFALVHEFAKLNNTSLIWLNIPICIAISWVFISMDRVGEATENPFEGGANDIPMTSMSRTIEIDLLEMLDAAALPEPISAVNNILM